MSRHKTEDVEDERMKSHFIINDGITYCRGLDDRKQETGA